MVVTLLGKGEICPLQRNSTNGLVLVHYDREAIPFYFQGLIPFSFMYFPTSRGENKNEPKSCDKYAFAKKKKSLLWHLALPI